MSRAHRAPEPWVVVGGSGFIGTALVRRLAAAGHAVTVVDRNPPRPPVRDGVDWLAVDLLESDTTIELPPGRVAVLIGSSEPAPSWSWTVPLDHAFATARLAPALRDRDVVLASSVEIYGRACAPLHEATVPDLPISVAALDAWVARVRAMAETGHCAPHRAAPLCRELAAHDPSGRWVYAMAKLAEERVLCAAPVASLRIVRIGNVVGVGQERMLTTLVRSAFADRTVRLSHPVARSFVPVDDVVAAISEHDRPGVWNVGGHVVALEVLAQMVGDRIARPLRIELVPVPDDDSCGVVDSGAYLGHGGRFTPLATMVDSMVERLALETGPVFVPPIGVVTPPRPVRPDVVADRHAAALWHGRLKAGQPWSRTLSDELASALGLPEGGELTVVPTVSGTAALRLAIAAVAGPARPGQRAILPSYTFPATAEAVVQMGYRPRFVDVDLETWTLDPRAVERALEHERAGVVVGVDTFGNPLAYDELRRVCTAHGVPFVADSAAALGSLIAGVPVGSQADAHAFSMSFAKTVVAGGTGGAIVLPRPLADRLEGPAGWDRSELMAELHAITALDQLEALAGIVARRRSLVARYRERLDGTGLVAQAPTPGCDPVLAHFVVRVTGGGRDALAHALLDLGIETKPYFPALHRTTHPDPAWAPDPLVVTEVLHQEALAIPLSSEMTARDIDRVLVGLERSGALAPASVAEHRSQPVTSVT